MMKFSPVVAFTFAALLAVPTLGHAQTQPDPHHLVEQGADVAPGSQDQQSMPMMNMMGGMMKMMSGMMKMMDESQMGMGGMDMSGMGMTERVEGRIAFLRAELQIAGSQSKVWDAFADALRSNAKRLKEANMPVMSDASTPQVLAQLASEERMLAARLDGVRAMKAAFVPLYDSLSAEQRKAADELLATHMGLMPSGMMPGGMMPKRVQ
jgi:hypothetical protein